MLGAIQAVQLPLLSSKGGALLPQLIHDYLLRHCYCHTAALMHRELLGVGGEAGSSAQQACMEDIVQRQHAHELVCQGSIEEAVRLVSQVGQGG